MSGDHKQNYKASAAQIQAIRAAVAAAGVDSVAERPAPEEAPEDSAVSHLGDAHFLALCLEGTADQIGQKALTHLAQCPICRAEWARLQHLGAVWQDLEARHQLEMRRDAALKTVGAGFASKVWRPRISLAPLMSAQRASAAQAIPDPETITFPVFADGAPVVGLIATLCRRNHEFYALITPEDADAAARYGELTVVLTIVDEKDQSPILRGEIAIGVAVLLGTHLPLAATSTIEADLTPESKS